ncbi:MAG: BREX-2 system phosphatase PglZ [Acidocella sp.]|nr:BREX-2 system phosphatase PglZ [Acidocella sp.]
MVTASPSIEVIRAQIRAIRDKAPSAGVFGIFSPGKWTGPEIHGTGNDQVAVYQCDSPLQMRLALQNAPETAAATVLVTPLEEGKVSDDILVRMALRKLHPINKWEIVRSLFNAKQLDPRITQHAFLAEMLLEHAGNQDFQPVAGGLVDADTVWGILLSERLGFSGAHPDVVEILCCAAECGLAERWQACPREFRDEARTWIAKTAGDTARIVLGCIDGAYGSNLLAIGLVMDVVYHEDVGRELDKAAGRLEGYIGTGNVSADIAQRWRDAAVIAAAQLSNATQRRCIDEAEKILDNIGAASHAWRSSELDSGFEQRLSRLGQALAAHIDARAITISGELRNMYGSALQHRKGREGGRRMERAEMAIRLARWLADQNAGDHAAAFSLQASARGYAGDGGFVDWSRQVLRGGEPNKDLAAAYVHLVDRVTELREGENLKFGQAVADQHAAGDISSGLIPVEQILDEVVAKAMAKQPVLLLLVDGMSWAVFRELVSDIKSHNWIELGFAPGPSRMIGITALPSVTEVCRTSLLCGSLKRGQAFDEVHGFAAHRALTQLSQPGYLPKLFHKAALEGDEDSSLAGDIREALAEKKQRVVGIVINAVDDHLDKGDQMDAIWKMQHIRVLEPILAEAKAAGRLVVLLSDHGHILDRQTEGREATDGLRWRRPGGEVAKGELEISSPRVVLPDGGRVIVPWSELVRYGPKKNGYHGGVSPQEMLIPVSILWPELHVPDDFEELPGDIPLWWAEPMAARPVARLVVEPPRPAKQKAAPPTLFDQPKTTPAAAAPEELWIRALLQSDVFAVQRKLAGRVSVDEVKFQHLLVALASRGGSMTIPALASAIAMPEHRLPGFLAGMQRLLNVEGYAILDRQDAANKVELNVTLLKRQFELDP